MIRTLTIAGALLALLVAVTAVAQPRTVVPTKIVWLPPQLRVDGAPFEIVAENGYYKMTWVRGSQTGVIRLDPTATEFPIVEFKANTTFNLVACDDQDLCSSVSNTVKKPGGAPIATEIRME